MAARALEAQRGRGTVVSAALAAFVALGAVAVLVLPEAADDVPHPGRDDQAGYALTGLGMTIATAAFVYALAAAGREALERTLLPAIAYGTGLAIVKFVLSPIAFSKSSGVSLGEFVTSGLLVLPVYLAVIAFLYSVAARRPGEWPLASKLRVAVLLGVLAVATRYTASLVLGTASEYVRSLSGTGLVLPVVAALAALAVMEAFDRSRPSVRAALLQAVAILIVDHVLWVVYMYRLF